MMNLPKIALVSLACVASIAIAAASSLTLEAAGGYHDKTAPGPLPELPDSAVPADLSVAAAGTPWAKLASASGYSLAGFAGESGGGFLFTGYTNSYGTQGGDLWIFTLGADGTPSSSSLYGGPSNDIGIPFKTSDGGYIAAGTTSSGTGPIANWVLRVGSGGAIAWQKTFPANFTLSPLITSLPDGYILLSTYLDLGSFTLKTVVVKLDLAGGVAWMKEYLPTTNDVLTGTRVLRLSDDNLLMYGTLTNKVSADPDAFLMKMNSDGTPQWTKRYGGTAQDLALQLLVLGDGTFLLQGSTKSWGMGGSPNGVGDAWLLKLEDSGAIQWQTAYGGAIDEETIVQADTAGGYILSGTTTSFGAGQEDVWAVKLNASGGIVWQKTYGGAGSDIGYVSSDSAGGYLLSGYTSSFGAGGTDVWVAKLDATGGVLWQNTYGTAMDDVGDGLRLSTGDMLIVGQQSEISAPTLSSEDMWFVHANATGGLGQSCSFIAPTTVTAATSPGVPTTSEATAVSVTVTSSTPSITAGTGTFTRTSGPFTDTDICSVNPGCTTPQDCDDSNLCTTDACESNTCTHTNNTASCSDGNACTTGDACSNGSCVGGPATNCDDANPCTNDSCIPATGCAHANNTAPCSDGNACTTGDACSNGSCAGGTATNCDDGNACTTDSCDTGTGACSHPPLDCDDGDECTADSCVPATGCVHEPLGCGPLQLLTPNGGGTVGAGEDAAITWQAPATAAKFNLQYTVDNGSTWKTIVTGVTGRSYVWRVPTQGGNKPKSKVKVIAFNASSAKIGSDTSDSPFTIEVVRVHAPNGGETLVSGAPAEIIWVTHETKKPIAKVKLLYTINGGSAWKSIVTLTGNPVPYSWTVPTVTASKTNCKVRVILQDSAGNSLGKDDSDLKFTINP